MKGFISYKNCMEEKPILFFNSSEEDKETYLFLKSSGIDCKYFAPTLDESPVLLWGTREFVGLNKIKEFVNLIKENE